MIDRAGRYRVTGLLPGTHSVLVTRAGHVGRSHVLALTTSRSKDYASFGPAFATATATLDLDGWPIHEGFLQYGAFNMGVSTADGRTALVPAAARIAPGVYPSTGLYSEDENFQHASPYDVVLPDSLQHLVLHEGVNALGAKHLLTAGIRGAGRAGRPSRASTERPAPGASPRAGRRSRGRAGRRRARSRTPRPPR